MERQMTTRLRLLQEYQDLNESHHAVRVGQPSALEFARMVHLSRPVLFKNCPLSLRVPWTDEYLGSAVGEISVAVTPNGRADALVEDEDGTTYFAEPLVETMTMKELLLRLSPGHRWHIEDGRT